MNLRHITACSRSCNGFGRIDHHAVKLAQCGGGFFTLCCLALKGVVNRLAKSVPHFLLLLALNRHALCFMLPALLQRLDGINAHHRLCTQRLGFFDHGFAACQACRACSFKRRVGSVHRGLPLRLDFCKGFFAQVSGALPLFDKAIQAADMRLPVGTDFVGISPGLHFVNQQLALGFDRFGLFFNGL